jgi:hypothetical protein
LKYWEPVMVLRVKLIKKLVHEEHESHKMLKH